MSPAPGLTRRSLLTGAAAALGVAAAARLAARPEVRRAALEANARLGTALSAPARLAPEEAANPAAPLRVNGDIGLDDDLDPAAWRLLVTLSGQTHALTLADLALLPRRTCSVRFYCVEGWSTPARWSGFRVADLAASLGLSRPQNLGAATPDGAYYIGLDGPAAWHPQTLLADTLNGAPLSPDHGAPLRLVVPVKYGIKSLKRLGTLSFTTLRPPDYWAERGYDWYAGL